MKNLLIVLILVIVAVTSFIAGQSSNSSREIESESLEKKSLSGNGNLPEREHLTKNKIIEKEALETELIDGEEPTEWFQENEQFSPIYPTEEPSKTIEELAREKAGELGKSINLEPSLLPSLANMIMEKMESDALVYDELSNFIQSSNATDLILRSDESLTDVERQERELLLNQENILDTFTEKMERNRQNYENQIRSMLDESEINAYIDQGISELAKFRADINGMMVETLENVLPDLSSDQKYTINRSLEESLLIEPEEFLIGSTIEYDGADDALIRTTYSAQHNSNVQKIIRDTLTVEQNQRLVNYFEFGSPSG